MKHRKAKITSKGAPEDRAAEDASRTLDEAEKLRVDRIVRDLVICIDAHFEELHCVLWPGRSYDLTDKRERVEATAWLAETILRVIGQEGLLG